MKLIKVSLEQATNMARGTIMADYDSVRCDLIVADILDNWKHLGFIKGFKRPKQNAAEQESL